MTKSDSNRVVQMFSSEEGIHEYVPEKWAQGISLYGASEDIHKFSQSVGGDYRCGSSIIDGANDRYSVFG